MIYFQRISSLSLKENIFRNIKAKYLSMNFCCDYEYLIRAVWRHKASNMAASISGNLELVSLQ